MAGPLQGIRVLDFSIVVQGPQCAAMLADLGADVIKIERKDYGDVARLIPIDLADRRSAYYFACNRGKRSVALDITVPAGLEVALKLIETADVMVTGFVPGVMERLGLGYDVCSAVNPRLIYATASALGAEGPDAQRKGVDLVGQAVGGLMRTTGQDGEFPTPAGAVIADSAGGLALAIGIVAALFHRERMGTGQRVDSSLLGGQIWLQAGEMSYYLMAGRNTERANRGHPRIAGVYRVFETGDGHLVIAGVTEREREGFFRAIDRPDLAADPRFSSAGGLLAHLSDLVAILEPVFRARTTAEWVERFGRENQRFAPVNDYRAVEAYEQAHANGYLRRVAHPEWGDMTIVGNPVTLSETPADPGATAPELGQHMEEVLLEAGYTWDEISALRERGAF